MQYLRIENPVQVVPSMEMLRTFGASSSRGTEKIGQFGSGTGSAMALCVREDIKTKYCLGKDVYTIETKCNVAKTSQGGKFDIHELILKKQNGSSVNLNMSVEFGALDWHGASMALREFVSNAIDGSIMPSDVKLEFVEESQCRAKDGTVRIYVEATDDVREYVRDIHKHFLCLSQSYNPNQTILPNKDDGPALMYRKGVRVGSFGSRSLFNYNIHNLDLKESRVVDSYHARERAARAILHADVATIVAYLKGWEDGRNYWEKDLSAYDFCIEDQGKYGDSQIPVRWAEAYKQVYGNSVVCETPEIAHIVRSKGHLTRVFNNTLSGIVKQIPGVKKSSEVLTQDEIEERAISYPTADVEDCLNTIWGFLQDNKLTNGKSKPTAHCFNEITKQEGTRLGFYRNDAVYIHQDIAKKCGMLFQTMIEEVAHHVTGARDCTRDFQDFAFRLASLAMSYIL